MQFNTLQQNSRYFLDAMHLANIDRCSIEFSFDYDQHLDIEAVELPESAVTEALVVKMQQGTNICHLEFDDAVKALAAMCEPGFEDLPEDSQNSTYDGANGTIVITSDGHVVVQRSLSYTGEYESEGGSWSVEEDNPLNDNHKMVADCLRDHGIRYAYITYSGGGDSGQLDCVVCEGNDGSDVDVSDLVIENWVAERSYYDLASKTFVVEKSPPTSISLTEALQKLGWDTMDVLGIGGWENNEGGKGEITIHSDGTLEIMHTSYCQLDADLDPIDFHIVQATVTENTAEPTTSASGHA